MNNKLQLIRPALSASALAFGLLAALPALPVAAKTEVPVQVSASTSASPRTGQPLSVTLSFRTAKGGQSLSTRYTTEGGVVLQSAPSEQLSSDAQGRATTTVTLTPTSDGVHFLNVFATVGGRTRAVSVPLSVGTQDARQGPLQARSAAPTRNGFIELKADERVR